MSSKQLAGAATSRHGGHGRRRTIAAAVTMGFAAATIGLGPFAGVLAAHADTQPAAGTETPPFPLTTADGAPAPETALVARVYYGDRDRLTTLVSQYDVFEFADHTQGYVLARLEERELAELAAAGFRVEAEEVLTQELRRAPRLAGPQLAGIALYPCYRTVAETYATLDRLAAQRPELATVVTIGSSWEKTHTEGRAGRDLRVLVLTSRVRSEPKPRFLLLAAHHARELTTAETATRFAEELVAGYGVEADATWLLDHHEIHVLPQANPDGRRWAELGYWWRKNTCNTNGCASFPDFGTDLNRNAGFQWGSVGSSAAACNELYRGPAPFSEPENQAIRDYVRALFPPQRTPDDTSPAPPEASGLLISLHSFSELVLYPWGWTTAPAPNQAGLATLGAKFGFFNRHAVQPSTELYPTSGSLDDWAYGELGVASYTFELGRAFFESCADFTTTVYPRNRDALGYAAKACRRPYLAPAGPDVLAPTVPTATNLVGARLRLTARVDATRLFGTRLPQPVSRIAAARYTVDEPSWLSPGLPGTFAAADGAFDSTNETVVATLDTATWPPGRHTIFIEGQSEAGVWGVPTALFLWITPLTLQASPEAAGLVLQWPGLVDRTYSVLEAAGLDAPFTALATGLPGRPPVNTFTVPADHSGARFYRVRLDP